MKPLSAVEVVKASSRHLRGSLADELADGTPQFAADSTHLLKFHGIYQQDDRDLRKARAAKRLPLEYSCMVRTSVPGGVLTAQQWLALDDVAGELANATLRITTRQGVQFHFVAKQGLRPLIGTLNQHLVTTLGACGDVVRNITACPAPLADRRQDEILEAARVLATRFRPHTPAYYELWLDGEQAVTAQHVAPAEEPIYGDTYLPRKFKIGLAWPGDNCIDVYTQDVGLVPHELDGAPGYVVLVGGGMGMTHAREEDTYPRLATELGWIEKEHLADVTEAIVGVQRDYGDRTDRHRARLKYTIDDRGEEWFRAAVGERIDSELTDAPPLPHWDDSDEHLGWFEQADGRWFLGVHVDSGRVLDRDDQKQRTALREIAEQFENEFRLTARQDVLLCGIAKEDRAGVDAVLARHGVPTASTLRPVHRLAVACPALPTCGQALGEAERVLPAVVDGVHSVLVQTGLAGLPLRVNMTGCPNGCARPYTAEVGIVGRTKTTYDVYVGGAVGGDRLAERLATDVKLKDLPATLAPLLERFATEALDDEGFGDFCARLGVEKLAELLPVRERPRLERPGRRVSSGEEE